VLTREELAARVIAQTGTPHLGEVPRESWGALLKPPAFLGQLCFGPSAGQNVRFTRPASWLGPAEAVPVDDALAEVTRRFLGAHGPATREDYGRWFGRVSPANSLQRIEALGDEVDEVSIDGARAFLPAGEARAAAEGGPPGSVRLIPAFDHYVVAAADHAERLMPKPLRARVYRQAGWLSPVLLVDGRMDGVWRHERKGKRLLVTIEPFVKVTARTRRAAEEEAERLARYVATSGSVPFIAVEWA
jgi:hypothetical protein